MNEPSKHPKQGPAEQKVRPETAKRNDQSEAPTVKRPWETNPDQGGVAPGGPSEDPESGA
ncbi:hypothetical protein CYL20_04855 [Pseudomonas palleroniana]|uniref:Uncharacterized protein n=1 Tax=Pseudomonas palleroniana TaxID=191390 RepID=A0A2L1J603_9PSED|nr:hypothetical protein [Pseudomonas palleroniana]AVE03899.1 hypothetical protein CYL20_04855 [Pseudomonas palleroniana]